MRAAMVCQMSHAVSGRRSMAYSSGEFVQLSIVVCTFNRAHQLATALQHIVESADRSSLTTEVVVVDNNSTDETRAVVAAAAASSPVPIRYASEKRQGLSFARNRGLKEAKGEIVAFTDDDCIVAPDWVSAIWRELEVYPDAAVLGGRVDLYNPADAPIAVRPFTDRVRYTNAGEIYQFIIGCNLAVRRSAARELGEFDPALGGTKRVVADDIEYVYRAFRRGFGVQFSPAPQVLHNHGRRQRDELQAVSRSYVKGRGAFFCKYALKGDATILRHAWWEVRSHMAWTGKPAEGSGLSSRQMLGLLAAGAIHFIATRLRIVRP